MCNLTIMGPTPRVCDLGGGTQYFAFLTSSQVLLILTGPETTL